MYFHSPSSNFYKKKKLLYQDWKGWQSISRCKYFPQKYHSILGPKQMKPRISGNLQYGVTIGHRLNSDDFCSFYWFPNQLTILLWRYLKTVAQSFLLGNPSVFKMKNACKFMKLEIVNIFRKDKKKWLNKTRRPNINYKANLWISKLILAMWASLYGKKL